MRTSPNSTEIDGTNFKSSAVRNAVAVDQDASGRVWALGAPPATNGFQIARLGPDGQLDTSFGTDGYATWTAGNANHRDLLVDSAGRGIAIGNTNVVAADQQLKLARFLPDGQLDPTYGDSGIVTISHPAGIKTEARTLAIDAAGRLLVAARSNNGRLQILRLTDTGQLDPAFGTAGMTDLAATGAIGPIGTSILTDGRIAVGHQAGSSLNAIMINPDGARDLSFGTNGTATIPVPDATQVQEWTLTHDITGRIIVAGNASVDGIAHALLARFMPDGTPDLTVGGTTATILTSLGDEFSTARAVLIDSQQRIIIVGRTRIDSQIVIAVAAFQ